MFPAATCLIAGGELPLVKLLGNYSGVSVGMGG